MIAIVPPYGSTRNQAKWGIDHTQLQPAAGSQVEGGGGQNLLFASCRQRGHDALGKDRTELRIRLRIQLGLGLDFGLALCGLDLGLDLGLDFGFGLGLEVCVCLQVRPCRQQDAYEEGIPMVRGRLRLRLRFRLRITNGIQAVWTIFGTWWTGRGVWCRAR